MPPPFSAPPFSSSLTNNSPVHLLVLLIILAAHPWSVSVSGLYVASPLASPLLSSDGTTNSNYNSDDAGRPPGTAASPSSSSGSHHARRRLFRTGTFRSCPTLHCRRMILQDAYSEDGTWEEDEPKDPANDDYDDDDQRTKAYGRPGFEDEIRKYERTTIKSANEDETRGGSRSPGRRRALRAVAASSLATMMGVVVVAGSGGAARDPTGAGTAFESAAAWALDDNGKTAGAALPPRSALQDRIDRNLLSQPTYGMDGPDVYYPSYVLLLLRRSLVGRSK
jgi:hypothetical protein